MTRITGKPVEKPAPTSAQQIDRRIAELAAFKDSAVRVRALQAYVRWLLRPRAKRRGRLASPETERAQIMADWEVFDAVESILAQGRASSIADACEELAADRGLKGKAPENGLRKAYFKHKRRGL